MFQDDHYHENPVIRKTYNKPQQHLEVQKETNKRPALPRNMT